MNAWIKSLLWVVPRDHSAAVLPVLVAGGVTFVCLALAYLSPVNRGELERTFDAAWAKGSCAAAKVTSCRVNAKAVANADSDTASPLLMGIKLSSDLRSQPASLVVQTNLEPDVFRSAAARAGFWPRMKSALAQATVEPLSAQEPAAPTAPAPQNSKRRRP
jgi:hypothetical protein